MRIAQRGVSDRDRGARSGGHQAGAAGVGSLGLSTDSAAIATWMGSALQWAHADDSGAR